MAWGEVAVVGEGEGRAGSVNQEEVSEDVAFREDISHP